MRRKVVIHLRGSEFGAFYARMPGFSRSLTRAIFKRVSKVIVLGQSLRSVFKGLVSEDRIAVIPNGIDYQQFACMPANSLNGCRKILFLSSLRKRKGLFQVIQALPYVLARCPGV